MALEPPRKHEAPLAQIAPMPIRTSAPVGQLCAETLEGVGPEVASSPTRAYGHVAITLAVSSHDYVATGHCWLNVHTDTVWAFVGPMFLVLTVSGRPGGLAGRDMWARGRPFGPLKPGLQANTCTMSGACSHTRMLSPQPCCNSKSKSRYAEAQTGGVGKEVATCGAHWV